LEQPGSIKKSTAILATVQYFAVHYFLLYASRDHHYKFAKISQHPESKVFSFLRTVQQVAALPLARRKGGVSVLLVTSRKSKRWILPKGWPKRHETLPAAAMREALEEAGVIGRAHHAPVGGYTYRKKMPEGYAVRSHVFVFPMLVHEILDKWEENKARARQWVLLEDAANILGGKDEARLLAEVTDGGNLQTVFSELGTNFETENRT
tara:strand:+ start:42 stop:665 length:624 start_codon:yes stop_codon:yes gene_type:complete